VDPLYSADRQCNVPNNFLGEFGVDIARKGDAYFVQITCPSSITNDVSMRPGMSTLAPFTPFVPKEWVVADFNAMCSDATTRFPASESGKITTESKAAAVLAKFTRKFSVSAAEIHETDPLKSKSFWMKDSDTTYKVIFSVYPYRNGSKVVYREEHAVTCASSLPCAGFDPSLASRLQEKILAAAND
jgi:hypothetical protein